VQRVGAATSDDLSTWTKLAGPLVEADARWYERYDPRLGQDGLVDTAGYSEAWRDPWVIADPDGDGWLMLTTARRPFGRPEGRGVIGVARSTDLRSWQVGPPIVAGDEFGQFEVPQLLRIAGRWAIVFCLASANHAPGRHERGAPIWTGNGVMVADDLAGPWHVCDEPYLGAPHYAARIVERDGRLLALSWLDVVDGAFSGVLADPVDVTERLTAMVSRA
jgi:beta-fructofuranosidase